MPTRVKLGSGKRSLARPGCASRRRFTRFENAINLAEGGRSKSGSTRVEDQEHDEEGDVYDTSADIKPAQAKDGLSSKLEYPTRLAPQMGIGLDGADEPSSQYNTYYK